MFTKLLYVLTLVVGITVIVSYGGDGIASLPTLTGAGFFMLGLAGLIRS